MISHFALLLLFTTRTFCSYDKDLKPYPFFVRSTSNFLCGGTIIAPKWVLTVADCEFSGLVYWLQSEETPGKWIEMNGKIIETFNLTLRYTNEAENKGLALLKVIKNRSCNRFPVNFQSKLFQLEKPIIMDSYVKQVRFVPLNWRLPSTLTVLSWRSKPISEGEFDYVLLPNRRIDFIEGIASDKCSAVYHEFRISEIMVCGKDPKYEGHLDGSYGGPVLLARATQIGIVAPLFYRTAPIFLQIAPFMDQIEEATGLKLNIEGYLKPKSHFIA